MNGSKGDLLVLLSAPPDESSADQVSLLSRPRCACPTRLDWFAAALLLQAVEQIARKEWGKHTNREEPGR